MNKREKITFFKQQLAELKIHKNVLHQSLVSIASRERYLLMELESVGETNSTREGKYDNVLSDKQKLQLLSGMTRTK